MIVTAGNIAAADVTIIRAVEVLPGLKTGERRRIAPCIANDVIIEPASISCDPCLKRRVLTRAALSACLLSEIDEGPKA
jgi:hypothetical protein